MNALTFEETNLLCIYNPAMTDAEFDELELYPDFDE